MRRRFLRPRSSLLVVALVCLAPHLALEAGQAPGATLFVTPDDLVWNPSGRAVAHDVVRGDLVVLRSYGGDFSLATEECLANDHRGTSLPFPGQPPEGEAFWFLVRGVLLGGLDNESYDGGGPGQVAPRDGGIAASRSPCPSVDLEEQARAQVAQLFGLPYEAFLQTMLAAGRTPADGPGEVLASGPDSAALATPGWFTLHHGRDKAGDLLQVTNPSDVPVTLFIAVVQEHLDPADPLPALSVAPAPAPFGSPSERLEVRTLERDFVSLLDPGGVLNIGASEVRAIGLIGGVAGDFSQQVTLGVAYQVAGLGPAWFFQDPLAPLCAGICHPVLDPFCWICSTHYGCPSTHPKCLATSYSVCWGGGLGEWLDEDTCACFP